MQTDSMPRRMPRLSRKPLLVRQPRGTYGAKWAFEKVTQVVGSAFTVVRHGRPDLLLYYDGGIGDELLCTAVLRELRRRDPGHCRKVWFRCAYPELFRYNTDSDRFVLGGYGLKWMTRRMKGQAIYPIYIMEVPESDYYLPPPCHIITRMCEMVGLTGEVTLRPYLELSPEERAAGLQVERQVAIQSSGTNARFIHMNKQWYVDRFQEVVHALESRYNFVQIGSPSDPPLDGALDYRGKTTMRETAAILSRSLAFVGQVGFPMHLARAVECRSVIVYGGKELPEQSGYTCNENLAVRLPCSPCWRENDCAYDRECMRRIEPEMVVRAIERQVERYGTPLVEDRATIHFHDEKMQKETMQKETMQKETIQ